MYNKRASIERKFNRIDTLSADPWQTVVLRSMIASRINALDGSFAGRLCENIPSRRELRAAIARLKAAENE